MLQGISGPQKFQVHKAYGPQDRLPSAHTCFNQLDMLEYETKELLKDRLMVRTPCAGLHCACCLSYLTRPLTALAQICHWLGAAGRLQP